MPEAARVIDLFRQFPLEFLDRLPERHVIAMKGAAEAFHQTLAAVQSFSPKQESPSNAHAAAIAAVSGQYQQVFNQLEPHISYAASLQRDVTGLEQQFRAAIQRANDKADELTAQLAQRQSEASAILEDVRKVAAETGVAQQASYFAEESAKHEKAAKDWRGWTIKTAIGLGIYALATGVLHKLPWIKPESTYDTVQLGISKVLIFVVIAYMLLLCARNFLGHMHNAIVNKHRQNALLTFKALADAAGSEQNRDIVLTHAAACIYAPQETSYTKGGSPGQQDGSLNIIQAISKLAGGGSSSH